MAGVPITLSSATGDLNGANGAARVSLYDASGNPMFFTDASAFSATTTSGIVSMGLDHDTLRPIQVSRDGRTEIPSRRHLLLEMVEGATLNTQRWTSTTATMTITQAVTTGILFNASAITTINTGAMLTSRVQHLYATMGPMHFRARLRSTAVANQEWFAGLSFQGTLSSTAVVDQGAFWKFGTDGTIKPALWYAAAEVSLGTDVAASIASANYYDYHVHLDEDRAVFQVFRTDTGALVSKQTLRLPSTQPRLFGATHVYTLIRLRNSGSAPASAGQLFVTQVETAQLELNHIVTLNQALSETGYTTSYSPTAYTQLAQFANSAVPASATLSNTAAGYTTLGGIYQFANLAGANTDYCLFGFTVPAPYRLKVRSIHIAMWNTGAANAATPATMCMWGLGLNGASANLSTGGHIRRTLGQTTIPISAAIGASANDIDVAFAEPLVSEPGTNFAIILRVVAGAATASQVIQGCVDVRGVFE